MRVVVNDYVYSLIKTSSLKNLNITEVDYRELEKIADDRALLEALEPFFPGISQIQNPSLIRIEKRLFSIYFKLYEKLLASSPQQMQEFLKSMLIRYEISNIKTFLMARIINMDQKEIQSEILMEPEQIMRRKEFIEKILSIPELEEAIEFLKKHTPYSKVIDRGWYYYKETNEVFLLESLLDKFYFDYMLDSLTKYHGLELKLFTGIVEILIDKYNLMLIFRSIHNNIPKNLLKQLIIFKGRLLTEKFLNRLYNEKTEEGFLNSLKEILTTEKNYQLYNLDEQIVKHLRNKKKIHRMLESLTVEDPITPIFEELDTSIFKMVYPKAKDNFDVQAIRNIINLVYYKEKEIFKVITFFVKIYHKNKNQ